MSIDYGPLAAMIGVWQGDRGVDIAPGPRGDMRSEFSEVLQIKGSGSPINAGKQTLLTATYRQIIRDKTSHRIMHEQVGYWSYDPETRVISQSVDTPRAVCILAGGILQPDQKHLALRVKAHVNNPDWGIVQSPFMREHARCIAYENIVSIQDGIMKYSQSTSIEIYGQVTQHTDQNHLTRRDAG